MTTALADQLDALHTEYVIAVNEAVASDDLARVARLAREHDRAAKALVTRHDGTVRVLPRESRGSRRTGLRRLTRRGRGTHAA